jgi:hypothetical protein
LAVVELEVSFLGKSQTSQNDVCASPPEWASDWGDDLDMLD